ncbi:MAG TPA: hypothetical protein VK975_00110 [Acidimicrobiales bacterium]|nr:hypothetical protein [Acidimicrobiales bacterium]
MAGGPFVIRNGRAVPIDSPEYRASRSTYGAPSRYNAAFTDPQLNAYLRSMGVEESGIRTGVRGQVRDAVRAWNVRQPQYREQLDEARQNIANDQESRGVYRSGATVTRQAGATRDMTRQYLADRQAVTDAVAGFQRAGAEAVARLRRERAERELTARQGATERAAQSVYGRGGRYF